MEQKKSGTALWAVLGVALVILIGCLVYILVTQYSDYKSNDNLTAHVGDTTGATVPPTAAPTEATTEPATEPSTSSIDDPAVIEEQVRTVFQAAQSAYTDMVNANSNTLPEESAFFYGTDASGIGFDTAQKLGDSFDASLITVYASSQGVEWISYDGSIYSATAGFIG